MWSLETYECLRIFLNQDAIFLSVACTHDGVLTGSSDGLVRFWEVDTADTPVGKGALSPHTRKKVRTTFVHEKCLRHRSYAVFAA